MDRLRELLQQGLENLTAEELGEFNGLLEAEANALLDSHEDPADLTDEEVATLRELSEMQAAYNVEAERREAAADSRRAEAAELARQFRPGEDDTDEDEGEPVELEPVVDEDETPEAEVEPVVEAHEDTPEPVVVASSTPAVVRRAPAAAPRPSSRAPRPSAQRTAALTAAMNLPGIQGGRRIDTPSERFAAFDAAIALLDKPFQDGYTPMPVLTADARGLMQGTEDLILDSDVYANQQKLDRRRAYIDSQSVEAITAAGGICAPVPYRYDLPTVGDGARPVRDALNRFAAVRGGVRTFNPPTIGDVTSAFGTWTEANDINPTAPATKPFMTIACNEVDTTTKVYAITRAFKIGNFRDRWYPEQLQAYMRLADVYHARYAESKLLAGIAAGSKLVTGPALLGAVKDTFTTLSALVEGMRYRHRIADGDLRIRVIGFEWVRQAMINDLIRTGTGDRLEERLRADASAFIDAAFANLGVNVSWSRDYQFGQTTTAGGAPPFGTQAPGVVNGFPYWGRFYVFPEGNWLFLDGGTLDVGVIRDSALVGTNDMMMFEESFENVHYFGVPGESYVYDTPMCMTGQMVAATASVTCTAPV
jgi:hypothetical protein